MTKLTARFGNVFKTVPYNKGMVCGLFKSLQDLAIARASEIEKKLHDKTDVLCEYETDIINAMSAPKLSLSAQDELKFYSETYTLILEGIEYIEKKDYWSFRYVMSKLSHLCKNALH